MIEDGINASEILEEKGYKTVRLTHNELMSSTGQEYHSKFANGVYDMLWVATPGDWYVRTPGRKTSPHWKKLQSWIKKAFAMGLILVLCGPPGYL